MPPSRLALGRPLPLVPPTLPGVRVFGPSAAGCLSFCELPGLRGAQGPLRKWQFSSRGGELEAPSAQLHQLPGRPRPPHSGRLTLPRKSKAKPNGKKPAAAEEKKVYLEPEYAKSRITDFGFKELVVLPREIDLNEWLASNTTTFFHHVNLQYSTISEFCTGEACQTMAVCNTQYYWYDERGKKVKCTAPQYVDFVMSSVQKLVTDEDVFPTKYGREFPSSFEALVRKICRYLFHVLAHIYSAHFKETLALELHGHLNTLYVHFILFAREFNLLDPKETAVMDDLTEALCGGGGGDGPGGAAGAQNHVKER
ncbi:MOB kinase activator 2 isoform X1 [Budorcas taxicolor]|uniref:MOB kinase activator 2 isoform X1 n=1 Tax=Budorcas taxicolor TaxID=37181 RepID=UPI002283AEE8|nr:MOB kinase activator 2 isoform X1 [Budorcas taxicolor]